MLFLPDPVCGGMIMLKLKKDYSCILRDKKTGKDLLTFFASAAGSPVYSAGFEGGGVASASQSLTIFTETQYAYKPLQHEIVIDGKTYILTSYSPSLHRKLGAGAWAKPRVLYVLNLE